MALETTRKKVIVSGYFDIDATFVGSKGWLYEAQVGSANELIAGRAMSLGTADWQLKLYDKDKGLYGFADMALGKGGYASSATTHGRLTYNDLYLQDTEPIVFINRGSGVLQGTLDDGQTVTKGMYLIAEDNTGKLQKFIGDQQIVGRALEDLDLSATPGDSLLKFVPLFDQPNRRTETLTVAANSGTLTDLPRSIEYIEATTETGLGNLLYQTDTGLTVTADAVTLTQTPVCFSFIEGQYKGTSYQAFNVSTTAGLTDTQTVLWDGATTLTFNATDAVATGTVDVGYLYRGGDNSNKKIIVSGTVRQGEAKIVYSTGVITFNATDNVTEAKVRYTF